jgi:hypothetical protein
MTKDKLLQQINELHETKEVQNFNEYAGMCEDIFSALIKNKEFLTIKGLQFIKEQLQQVYEQESY